MFLTSGENPKRIRGADTVGGGFTLQEPGLTREPGSCQDWSGGPHSPSRPRKGGDKVCCEKGRGGLAKRGGVYTMFRGSEG